MDFMPHGVCWLWNWKLILLHAPTDLVIFFAYMVTPAMAYRIFRAGGRHLPPTPRSMWRWFAAFVFFCGLTHLGGFLEVFFGGSLYYWTGLNKLVTAGVSLKFTWEMYRVYSELALIADVLAMEEP